MVMPEPMIGLVTGLLHGFEREGFRKAVLLSGHYPNRGEYIEPAVKAFRQSGGTMAVLALTENQVPGVGGDHAAKFETSFMLHLHPATVDMERLKTGSCDDPGGPDESKDWMDDRYRQHPCYGLVGADPRAHASAQTGRVNTERLTGFIAQWLTDPHPPSLAW